MYFLNALRKRKEVVALLPIKLLLYPKNMYFEAFLNLPQINCCQ